MFAAWSSARLILQGHTKEELQMNTLLLITLAGLILALPMLIGFFHFLHVKDKADALNGKLVFLKGHWPHLHQS